MTKSVPITKQMVKEAYLHVKKNKGGAGEDEMDLTALEADLEFQLYKVWNRLASGSYFPPKVKEVGIRKKDGGIRYLGIPTVIDRIAQQVLRSYLEPRMEELFHMNLYAYRPHRSAHAALSVVKKRNWDYGWVVEVDIRKFFDTVPHNLLLEALRKHVDTKSERWVLMYVERWLQAGVVKETGEIMESREVGTPQGGVISPLLSNLFLHYAFDAWMEKNHPLLRFVRYADDIIIHSRTLGQAEEILRQTSDRMGEVGLSLHPEKTRIVRCKSYRNPGSPKGMAVSFTFLGFKFKPQSMWSAKTRGHFLGYSCEMSSTAKQDKVRDLKKHRSLRDTSLSLEELSVSLNPKLRGWQQYYGHFNKWELNQVFYHLEQRLMRWVRKKYKFNSKRKAMHWLQQRRKQYPELFYHWTLRMGKDCVARAV